MRAAIVSQLGLTPAVGELPAPRPGPGQALVELAAAAVNPVDLAIAGGTFYGGHPPLPFAAGREGTARVLAGSAFAAGTRVHTLKAATGSLAERFLIDEASSWQLPDGDDDVVAASLGIAGLAGWLAVEERARLQPGERVLVLGATGTVGLVAVQAARLLGAGRIVAAGRDGGRLLRARELGADAVVHLGEVDDLERAFCDAFDGNGPDVVIDPLWGAPAVAAIKATVMNGRIVNLGQSAGAEATLASATVRGKRLQIIGHTVFEVPIEQLSQAHRTMLGHARDGALVVDAETFPLGRAAEAWERQKQGPHTKLVITPD